MSLKNELNTDAARYGGSRTIAAIRHPGFRVGMVWRIACHAQKKRIPFFPSLLRQLNLLAHSCDLSIHARVDGGLKLPHPTGIVVGDNTIIGPGVTLMQHSTLGGNFGKRRDSREVPTLSDGVFIGPGAAVLGPVNVDKNAKIGANQVVTSNYPSEQV